MTAFAQKLERSGLPALLLPSVLDSILDRIPAEKRAQAKWGAGSILHRLHDGPLTPETIAAASREFMQQSLELWTMLGDDSHELREAIEQGVHQAVKEDIASLGCYGDSIIIDMAEWVLGRILKYREIFLPYVTEDTLASWREDCEEESRSNSS